MMKNTIEDVSWTEGFYNENIDLKHALEARAATNKPMKNFNLTNANLSHINLVNKGSNEGYSLVNSDLYKANLEGAHCFKLNLSGSSLMKANFENANLHFADLRGCNLLGAKFKNAKLENVMWDHEVIQEQQAKVASTEEEEIDLYQQSEEIYRNLRKICEEDGLFETAGNFFQSEMKMRRKQMPKNSFKRIISKIVEFSCGYGELPFRIILLSLIIIAFFAVTFFLAGLVSNGEVFSAFTSNSRYELTYNFLNALYFSVVTFTTLGYGDILPLGISKFFAAIEALLGGFVLALFVVTFVKKMTR